MGWFNHQLDAIVWMDTGQEFSTWDARMLPQEGVGKSRFIVYREPLLKNVVILVVTVRNIPKYTVLFLTVYYIFIGHNCMVDVFNRGISDWNIISRTRIFRVFVGQFSGRQRPSKQNMHVSHLTFLIYNISPFQQTMPSSRKCHEKKSFLALPREECRAT